MFRIGSAPAPAPTRRRGPASPGLLAPLFALAGVAVVALLALVTLGLAFALTRRGGKAGGTRVWFGRRPSGERFGRAGERAAAPGAAPTDAPATPRAGHPESNDSYAEVLEAWPIVVAAALSLSALIAAPAEAKLLVPMDDVQADHLKAYGLTYWALQHGLKSEWLLNYRGGAFLFPEDPDLQRQANLRGVSVENMAGAAEASMRAEIADNNMEAVALEKPP